MDRRTDKQTYALSQSDRQSASQPASQSVSQSVSQPAIQSVSQSVNQSVSHHCLIWNKFCFHLCQIGCFVSVRFLPGGAQIQSM